VGLTDPSSEAEAPRRRTRRLWLVARALVSVGLLAYLLGILDWARLTEVLARVRVGYLLVAPPLVLAVLVLTGVRWSGVLSLLGGALGAARAFRIYLVASFYNVILPGVMGGDAIRVALGSRATGLPVTEAALSVLLERAAGMLVLLLLGGSVAMAAPAALTGRLGHELITTLVVLSWAALLGGLLAYGLLRWVWGRRPDGVAPPGRERDPGERPGLADRLRAVVRQVARVSPVGVVTFCGLTATAHSLDIVASFALGQALGIDVPLVMYFIVIPLAYFATLLPISLGGLGVREGVLTVLLVRLGGVDTDAVLLALLIYFNRVLIGLVGGVVQLVSGPEVRR